MSTFRLFQEVKNGTSGRFSEEIQVRWQRNLAPTPAWDEGRWRESGLIAVLVENNGYVAWPEREGVNLSNFEI